MDEACDMNILQNEIIPWKDLNNLMDLGGSTLSRAQPYQSWFAYNFHLQHIQGIGRKKSF